MNMNTKKILVSFLAIVSMLSLVAMIQATSELADVYEVKVDGIDVDTNDVSVIAGETASVRVFFIGLNDADNVRVKAEIEGEKIDVSDRTASFDVETGKKYSKTLSLKIPSELKDDVSDDLSLVIKIWNGDFETEVSEITLRVQRPSYNADLKSVNIPQTVEAGEMVPVDIVLKNTGYNDLDDVYVTVSVPALNIKVTSYFGDLVAIEDSEDDHHDDDQDSTSGRLFLKVPFSAKAGEYVVETEAKNDDTTNKVISKLVIENGLGSNAIVGVSSKSVAVGETAEYELLVVNPTNNVKVYRIVSESSNDLSTSVSESVIAIGAESSKTVKVSASSNKEGDYTFNVNVLSGEDLVSTVKLNAKVEGKSTAKSLSDPIVVLTVILAIIFIVLLIVLIVLIGKKPKKSEEFGESYY